jgi:cytochrome P450
MQETTRERGDAAMAEYALERYGRDIFGDFDINAECMKDNLENVVEDLLERCPVAHSNVGPGYPVFARQADVRRIGQDWKTFSSASGAFELVNDRQGPLLLPDESDPPKHTAWRRPLNPYFGPAAIGRYEAGIRADANELIDAFIDGGKCDAVAEFAAKLPGWAFFKNILHVPVEDLEMLVDGVHKGTFDLPERRAGHLGRVYAYLDEYLRQRATEPKRGDVVDLLVEGVTYEDGTKSPWEDRVSVLLTLTFGGISTSTFVMAGGLHHLATHVEDRRKLIRRPELSSRAVEEFIRVFPAAVALGRRCTRDVQVAGRQLKAGDWVMLLYGAASRDPEVVERPREIDIERETVVHSAFGVGLHRCLGSNFARLDIRCAIEEWLRRIPNFDVAPGFVPEFDAGVLRNMKRLDLVF